MQKERKDIGVMTLLPYYDSLDDAENVLTQGVQRQRLVKVKYELRNAYICDIPVNASKARPPTNCTKRVLLRRKMEAKSFTYNSMNRRRTNISTANSEGARPVPRSCLELLRNPMNSRNTKADSSVCEVHNKYVRRRSEHAFARNSQPMRLAEDTGKNCSTRLRVFESRREQSKRDVFKSDTSLIEEFVRNKLRPKSNGQGELNKRWNNMNVRTTKMLNETNVLASNFNNIGNSLPQIYGTKRCIFSNNVLKRKIVMYNEMADNKENIPVEREECVGEEHLNAKYQ
eukprot:TRINITY_DN6015_c0_g3_i2.p1 TRINITY_DN6015_c0_g3~~TRINITY_DN6015_c0_g3_i2.p1  ORF type:complete len:286 (-),score=44.27 TRINITY_DN6015_c0_g3_i2:72-929(-)